MTSANRAIRVGVCVLLVLGSTLSLTGCRERVCGEGDTPVYSAEGGGSCEPTGHPVTSPWMTYPPGQTPTYLDEIPQMRPTPGATGTSR